MHQLFETKNIQIASHEEVIVKLKTQIAEQASRIKLLEQTINPSIQKE